MADYDVTIFIFYLDSGSWKPSEKLEKRMNKIQQHTNTYFMFEFASVTRTGIR